MLNIDERAVWNIGRSVFATWFTGATLVGVFLFVRRTTNMALGKCVAAAAATTPASWLLVAAVPLPLVVSGIMRDFIFSDPGYSVGWILAAITSASVGTASGIVVLAAFRQRITRSGVAILFAVNLFCIVLTAYRTVAHVTVVAETPAHFTGLLSVDGVTGKVNRHGPGFGRKAASTDAAIALRDE
jgi:hypothetical protein